MGKSKDLATGETRFVNTSGDTMTGTLVAGTRLQVGDSSITQQFPNLGYVADFQASSGSQTFISIAEPSASSLGNNGVIIGEDTNNTYITQRSNKPVNIATSDTDRLIIDGSGRVRTPYQPAFKAYLTSTQANVTGNAAVHSNGYLWTSVFNIGSHFNDSGTFTAPVAGRYLFAGHWALLGTAMGDASYHTFPVNGSTPGYSSSGLSMFDPRSMEWDQNRINFGGTSILSLSVNDTVTMYGGNLDSGSANVAIVGGNAWHTTIFSGYFLG